MPARLTDSKRLDASTRERLDAEIRSHAVAWAVAHVSAAEIDALGIAQATAEAMRRAVSALGCPIDHVLVDGRHVELGHPTTAVVKGDASVRSIAAASIVAKVARDALMVELATGYEGYGLAVNKGYGSPDHLAAIRMRGPSEIHRRSFAPCSQTSLF
jgi:ribonuclease HII